MPTFIPPGLSFSSTHTIRSNRASKNAIEVGRELRAKGHSFGVRLDSGDIDYLARKVREKLDEAGFPDATIVVSNELDEVIIEHLVASGGAYRPLGGRNQSRHRAENEAAFTGVYKTVSHAKRRHRESRHESIR